MQLTGIMDAHEFRNRISERREALRPGARGTASPANGEAELLRRMADRLDEIAAWLRDQREGRARVRRGPRSSRSMHGASCMAESCKPLRGFRLTPPTTRRLMGMLKEPWDGPSMHRFGERRAARFNRPGSSGDIAPDHGEINHGLAV